MTSKRYRSRGAYPPELSLPRRTKNRFAPAIRGRRSAERRNANHCRACADKWTRTCAAHLLRGCAPLSEARSPSGASAAALARNCGIPDSAPAMLPGTRIETGVTRPLLSQSSDSTSRLGRNTEGNDAQSRSGADCYPARKHRTRSTLRIASGMRPSMSEILWLVS
jgi:hypothetical protein